MGRAGGPYRPLRALVLHAEAARAEALAALDRLQADIVAGRSLDVAPFRTIVDLHTVHAAAAAALGLDAEATTTQIA